MKTHTALRLALALQQFALALLVDIVMSTDESALRVVKIGAEVVKRCDQYLKARATYPAPVSVSVKQVG